ncbi:TPA: hypothetical protein ACORDH_002883 [Bacillus cereus]
MKSDIKLIQEDSLKVVAELRDGYVNFIREEEGKMGMGLVTVSYSDIEYAFAEVKAGRIGIDETRRGLEMHFLESGVAIHRPTEYVTLTKKQIEKIYNEIRKSQGLQEEDNKQDALEITKLQAQREILQEQIRMMHAKERELEKKIVEHQHSIERRKYKGKTLHEYFVSIAGCRVDGEFEIQISDYDRTIYVKTMNGDFELNVNGRYDEEMLPMLRVTKDTGVRYYEKEHYGGEIPKNHKTLYDRMVSIKNKYGKMIEDGTLEPKEDLK